MVSKRKSLLSLKRKIPKYKPREIVLIVCEGRKTEPNYFNSLKSELKLLNIEVEVCGRECDSAPVSIVEYAKSKKDQRRVTSKEVEYINNYDTIWCVMDVEVPIPHETLIKLLN